GERQRWPAILPGPTRLLRPVEHEEIPPRGKAELLEMIGRTQPGLAGADDDNIELERDARALGLIWHAWPPTIATTCRTALRREQPLGRCGVLTGTGVLIHDPR